MAGPPEIYSAPDPRRFDSPVVDAGRAVVLRLRSAGYEAYFAGGFVRDILIGRPIHDIDIATNAHPDTVATLFANSRTFGKSFGVVQVDSGPFQFEVATFRQDIDYRDGRRPSGVVFTTAAEDASRRDFTINGMFYDPVEHHVIDYVGGWTDIERRVVRAIGDPARRFEEDHLRIMRAVRFASVLNFTIDPATWTCIRASAPLLRAISMERIRDELMRTFMESVRPGEALALLRDAGVLDAVFPELSALQGVQQPPEFHPEGDVFEHVRLMLDLMKERSPELIWSILLHDIAKPATFAVGPGRDGKPRIRFHGHAEQGAVMAETIMRRFRCPNDMIAAVKQAVLRHMRFIAVPDMRLATRRKWVGAPTFPLELELHRIDCQSSHGKLDHYEQMLAFQKELAAEPALPAPLVTGRDLLKLGYASGPEMGDLLKQIYDAQLEGRFQSHDDAMAWVRDNIAPPGT